MASQAAISVRGLTKRYNDVIAVDDISFDIAAGKVFAFLGTNGAGKSTTISCVTTVSRFDVLSISVEGHSVRYAPEPIPRNHLTGGTPTAGNCPLHPLRPPRQVSSQCFVTSPVDRSCAAHACQLWAMLRTFALRV